MAVGKTGVATTFTVVGFAAGAATDPLSGIDGYSTYTGAGPVTVDSPSYYYPQPFNSGQQISVVSVAVCYPLPSHFRLPNGWSVDLGLDWTALVFGFQGVAYRDVGRIDGADVEPLVNIGVPGSVRRQVDGMPAPREPLEGLIIADVRRRYAAGVRAASATFYGAEAAYVEYIPDVRGGQWVDASLLFDYAAAVEEGYYPVTVEGEILTLVRLPGVNQTGTRVDLQLRPGVEDQIIGEAEFSLDGVVWSPGVVYRITALDYVRSAAVGTPANPYGYEGHACVYAEDGNIHNDRWTMCVLPLGPASDAYGGCVYAAAEEVPSRLYLSGEWLDMVRIKVEVYTGYAPPGPPLFWTELARAYEAL